MEMVKNWINYICLMEDGIFDSWVAGVFLEYDLMVMQGNNFVIFIWEIWCCKVVEVLWDICDCVEQLFKKYIFQEVLIVFIFMVMIEINDEIIICCIELVEEVLALEGQQCLQVKYCWFVLGSEGRGEQLLCIDQDNVFVFEDVLEDVYE